MALAGIYLHVPFCRRHCPFCDFAITTDYRLIPRWSSAIHRELEARAPRWADVRFDTVYLGGGTPSLLPVEEISRLLTRVRAALDITAAPEITLELNPGDLDHEQLADLRVLGIDRISLGIQSFADADLRFLGRDHDAAASLSTFADARSAGFSHITIDLIHGIPGRPIDDWREQIDRAAGLAPEHVSAYALTYEPGTPLTRWRDRGDFEALDETGSREFLLETHHRFESLGYPSYEVSSFSRGGEFPSRHNRKYWDFVPYLGLGPGAHSFRDGRRRWNLRSTRRYLEASEAGRPVRDAAEELTDEQRRLEIIFLGLRTRAGVDLDRLAAAGGEAFLERRRETLERHLASGNLRLEGRRLVPTTEGLAIADALAVELAI